MKDGRMMEAGLPGGLAGAIEGWHRQCEEGPQGAAAAWESAKAAAVPLGKEWLELLAAGLAGLLSEAEERLHEAQGEFLYAKAAFQKAEHRVLRLKVFAGDVKALQEKAAE